MGLLTYYKNTFRQGVSNDGGSHVGTSSICAVSLGVAKMCTRGSQVQPLYDHQKQVTQLGDFYYFMAPISFPAFVLTSSVPDAMQLKSSPSILSLGTMGSYNGKYSSGYHRETFPTQNWIPG